MISSSTNLTGLDMMERISCAVGLPEIQDCIDCRSIPIGLTLSINYTTEWDNIRNFVLVYQLDFRVDTANINKVG